MLAVPTAAQALGVVAAGLVMNKIGRRWSNFFMCAWAIMLVLLCHSSSFLLIHEQGCSRHGHVQNPGAANGRAANQLCVLRDGLR